MGVIVKKQISHNIKESELNEAATSELASYPVANMEIFRSQKTISKSPIQKLILQMIREVNRQKLNYDQLKYIFKTVRAECGVEVPSQSGRKLIELPSQDEIIRFYKGIDSPIHRLVFETLEGTGLRVAELCNLQVSRIDFKNNTAFVSEGKGKKDRIVIVGSILLEKIKLYLEGRKNRYLFESNRHTKFSTRRIEQLCEKYKIKAQIEKDFTPHTFRHLWNTRLAEAGISKERRAILAGHASEQTQTIYTHLSAGGVKDDVLGILDKIIDKK
jgi:integrase